MSFISEPDMFVKYEEVLDIELRAYQDASIAELRAGIKAGNRTQILASMVGSGKTVMAAFLLRECWRNNSPACFVVDRLSLLGQTSDVLDRYGIPHGVIQGTGNPRKKPGELIQVASIQTLKGRSWPEARLVIIDEAHILYDAHKKYIEKSNSLIIGLTATPFTRGLGKWFKGIVNVTTGNKLTAEGFLVPFKVWAAAEPDMTGAKVTAGEWGTDESSPRAVKIIGDVVKEYLAHGDNRKTIAFGVDVAHCEELQRQALSHGIRAELYTYRTMDEERDIMLREFRKPDSSIRWLISVAALSRGFDVPDVGCIIMCRPLKSSFSEFVQILGRGLRSHPEKADCIILDLAGNFMRHYPALVDFMEDGVNTLDDGKPKPKAEKKPVEKKPPRKCPACSYLPVAGSFCPACGHEMPSRSKVIHEQGELGEFAGTKASRFRSKMTTEDKARLFGELKFIRISKGYAQGWAANKFREMVGTWPNAYSAQPPVAPSAETVDKVNESNKRWAKSKAGNAWRKLTGRKEPAEPPRPVEADLFG